ncbi:putative Acyl-CoA dehydrogenase [Candidatus Terasakiella magnetica]|uniref:3-methylmercaptopropionyl-CoA dehydrogenase n=1 Tax=Candidatus Terasakiella magnetica TaxID=1867952 RepID=A0A1C3RK40_9PROT|nr:acyl-CoA dehydrogenase [Candidatus Terasakiella magnetica]SCA57660.1 putative Acyl-CoA dehydrogenase [Candidatus Terasakiella magnetica]
MTVYNAPLNEMEFLIKDVFDLDTITALPGYEEATEDMVDAILDEAGKLGRDIIAPLARTSDEQGATWKDNEVTTSPGFKEAYAQFIEGGWNGIGFDPEYGGMGLPFILSNAVSEIWNSSSVAFGLCPMLTGGAIEAIHHHASDEQKATYLEKMISGEWTGTMNLTEPSAGSDLAAVSAKAVPQEDGSYKISGQKIFITFGEHDMTDNIIHLVLARTPDAPAGSRGISLFIVPKFLVNEDGSLGERNPAYCISIEHKLGIHGSPTATMSFEEATGYLVKEENKGLACMFTMMNNARLNVGNEGFAAAERAYQCAREYAMERVQSPLLGSKDKTSVTIDKHPDVRRMLLTMKSKTEAARAISYFTARQQDIQAKSDDEAARTNADALIQLLTPIVKAYSTDIGIEVADDGIQVHGGMGFIEESGAPQWLRDVRITAIYEGTNGIQANDLIGRKVAMNGGAYLDVLMPLIKEDVAAAKAKGGVFAEMADALDVAITNTEKATQWLIESFKDDPKQAATGSVHYLRLMGNLCGGWLLTKSAIIAQAKLDAGQGDPNFMKAKINTARFFGEQILPVSSALKSMFIKGHGAVLDCEDEWL